MRFFALQKSQNQHSGTPAKAGCTNLRCQPPFPEIPDSAEGRKPFFELITGTFSPRQLKGSSVLVPDSLCDSFSILPLPPPFWEVSLMVSPNSEREDF